MAGDEEVSQHPIDRLLCELIASPHAVSRAQRRAIVSHIASAEFNRSGVTTEMRIRGLTYLDQTVQAWEDSLFVHLVRRVLVQRQWKEGTTGVEYVGDLRRAVLHPDAQIQVGVVNEQPAVLITAPNEIPPERRGRGAQPWLVVGYAPQRGMLVTGYQASRVRGLPGGWIL